MIIDRIKGFLTGTFYSFPVQLVLIQIKKNQFLLLFWLLLFGWVFRLMGTQYGVPYLFLDPEYLGDVTFWSYGILGFAFGGFIMAYHIASYIMNAFRFPFLATLSRPFFKFCVNNSILPLSFNFCFVYQIIVFQRFNEWTSALDITLDVLGFLFGQFLFILFSFTYFFAVLKDFRRLFGLEAEKRYETGKVSKTISRKMLRNLQWGQVKDSDNPDADKIRRVDYYLNGFLKWSPTRNTDHYDHRMLQQVFRQNHFMATVYVAFVLITIFTLGLFREVPQFEIPAGASIFLMLTMVLLALSALNTFFRSWSLIVFVFLFVIINFVSKLDFINYQTGAYGMKYDGEKAVYSTDSMIAQQKFIKQDYIHTVKILDNWRKRNAANTIKRKKKPKMVFITTSGGGLRSSLWTMYALQHADSLLNGELINHTSLITGSSGGMLGAAYLRELILQKKLGKISSYYKEEYAEDIAKDVLNPIAFSIAINDLFLRIQKFKRGNNSYVKDRGYAFEKALNTNTRGLINKNIIDYKIPEMEALIPMMVFSPTIINDGRSLLISAQNIAYMLDKNPSKMCINHPLPDAVEFRRMFKNQNADSLSILSTLRMNATFPYILPVAQLPSNPTLDIMDAGLTDNYGVGIAMRFIYSFRNWISSNTSGIIIIQLRDSHKLLPVKENPPTSILEMIGSPLGNIYNNLFNMMDFQQDGMVQSASLWLDCPVDVVDFELRSIELDTKDEISLSFHLTKKEKQKVKASIYLPENQNSITRLKQLLD